VLSKPWLHVEVDERGAFTYRPAEGATWRSGRNAAPPDTLRAEKVWEQLRTSPAEDIPPGARELARWLFDERAVACVREAVSVSDEDHPARVELKVPPALAAWPWEACLLDGLTRPLGVHTHLTFVRTSGRGAQEGRNASQLKVELVGVELDDGGEYAPLFTGQELDEIRQGIESAGGGSAMNVLVDPRGSWHDLADPHVFHFAGHGAEDGDGLIFRGRDGRAQPVSVSQLATVLVSRRKLELAFLNACYSARMNAESNTPLGGLAHTLTAEGVPAVVGIQARIASPAAQRLAEGFYAALAKGMGVDVALQRARRDLFLENHHAAWPFVVLSLNGSPNALCAAAGSAKVDGEPANLDALGFGDQEHQLNMLVESRQPTLVFVHGVARMGHTELLGRVQRELEKAGAALWRPVAALNFSAGDPVIQRQQLAGAIARSLNLPDAGDPAALEAEIAHAIAERTRDRVLVINVVHPIILEDTHEVDALDDLVDLWASLVRTAKSRAYLPPVFFLVPISYAKKRMLLGWDRAARATRGKLEQIADRQVDGVIQVLPELEPLSEKDLFDFFRVSCAKSKSDAARLAKLALREPDNEAIFERVRSWMKEWTRR
jgi:hypothetical protein